MEAYEKFNAIRLIVGNSAMLDEIVNILSTDQLNELCNDLIVNFDIDKEDLY